MSTHEPKGAGLSLAPALARRLPFYYGWIIAVVAGLVSLAGVAESPAILSIFFKEMSDDLGWSRTAISGAVLTGTGLIVIAAPVAGRLTDRYGARPVVTVGTTVTAACLTGIGYVQSLPVFYVLLSLSYAMNAGIARVAVNAVVAKWFVSSRGKATGVVSMFLGVGFIVMPIIAATVTEAAGWRMGWRVLGLTTFAIAVPIGFLLLRSLPADVGQQVDGTAPTAPDAKGQDARTALTEAQWTAKEAARTPTFWLVLVSLSTIAFSILGFAVHLVPHLQDRGLSLTTAALSFVVAGVTMLPASPAWGWFLDRFSARLGFVAAALIVVLFTALTLLAYNSWMVIPIGITMGLGFGGFGMVQRVIFANYFGRESAGSVLGLAVPFIAIAQGIGQFVAAVAFDVFNDYVAVFALFAGLVVVSIGVMFRVRPPIPAPVP